MDDPASRAKNGQPHLVPLSEPAIAILTGMPRIKGSGYVFTTDGEDPVSGFSRMKNRIDTLMGKGEPAEPPFRTGRFTTFAGPSPPACSASA